MVGRAKQRVIYTNEMNFDHADLTLDTGKAMQAIFSWVPEVSGWITRVSIAVNEITNFETAASSNNQAIVFDPFEEHQYASKDPASYSSYISEYTDFIIDPNPDMFLWRKAPLFIMMGDDDDPANVKSMFYREKSLSIPIDAGQEWRPTLYIRNSANPDAGELYITFFIEFEVADLDYYGQNLQQYNDNVEHEYVFGAHFEKGHFASGPMVWHPPTDGRIKGVRMTAYIGNINDNTDDFMWSFGTKPLTPLIDAITAAPGSHQEMSSISLPEYVLGDVLKEYVLSLQTYGNFNWITDFDDKEIFVKKDQPLYIDVTEDPEDVVSSWFFIEFTFIPNHDALVEYNIVHQRSDDLTADTTSNPFILPHDVYVEKIDVDISVNAGGTDIVGFIHICSTPHVPLQTPEQGRIGMIGTHGLTGMIRQPANIIKSQPITLGAGGTLNKTLDDIEIYEIWKAGQTIYYIFEITSGTVDDFVMSIHIMGRNRGKSRNWVRNVLDGYGILREEILEEEDHIT